MKHFVISLTGLNADRLSGFNYGSSSAFCRCFDGMLFAFVHLLRTCSRLSVLFQLLPVWRAVSDGDVRRQRVKWKSTKKGISSQYMLFFLMFGIFIQINIWSWCYVTDHSNTTVPLELAEIVHKLVFRSQAGVVSCTKTYIIKSKVVRISVGDDHTLSLNFKTSLFIRKEWIILRISSKNKMVQNQKNRLPARTRKK